MRIPFALQSYEHESKPLSAQRVVNCFSEIQPKDAKSPAALLFRPGLKAFSTIGSGPIRGVHEMADELYAVSGNALFSVDASGTGTNLGSVGSTSTGLVSMADNGNQLVVVNDNDGYVYDRLLGTLTQITDADFQQSSDVAQLDNYHIFIKLNSDQFFLSALSDPTSYDPLDFATAEGDSDLLVKIATDNKQLVLFGTDTTEVWYNSGNVFPFDRVSGVFIQEGLGAKYSVASLDNTLFWLSKNGVVFKLDGFTPLRVSTHAIEQAIKDISNFGDARAFDLKWKGHIFYILTFPDEATFVYDAATQLWHEWETFGQMGFIGCCHAQAYRKEIVGDQDAGKLYTLEDSAKDDDGTLIQKIATGAPLYASGKWAFMPSFEAIFETGVGVTAGQGSDPQAMMEYSDDGGRTWSNSLWRDLGKIGKYQTRTIWRRLGRFKERTIRVTVSDPVATRLLGANADLVGEA
ncbi:MAG: hypothetical protein ACR2QF_10245 [Geminicoccaceae bacterium]